MFLQYLSRRTGMLSILRTVSLRRNYGWMVKTRSDWRWFSLQLIRPFSEEKSIPIIAPSSTTVPSTFLDIPREEETKKKKKKQKYVNIYQFLQLQTDYDRFKFFLEKNTLWSDIPPDIQKELIVSFEENVVRYGIGEDQIQLLIEFGRKELEWNQFPSSLQDKIIKRLNHQEDIEPSVLANLLLGLTLLRFSEYPRRKEPSLASLRQSSKLSDEPIITKRKQQQIERVQRYIFNALSSLYESGEIFIKKNLRFIPNIIFHFTHTNLFSPWKELPEYIQTILEASIIHFIESKDRKLNSWDFLTICASLVKSEMQVTDLSSDLKNHLNKGFQNITKKRIPKHHYVMILEYFKDLQFSWDCFSSANRHTLVTLTPTIAPKLSFEDFIICLHSIGMLCFDHKTTDEEVFTEQFTVLHNQLLQSYENWEQKKPGRAEPYGRQLSFYFNYLKTLPDFKKRNLPVFYIPKIHDHMEENQRFLTQLWKAWDLERHRLDTKEETLFQSNWKRLKFLLQQEIMGNDIFPADIVVLDHNNDAIVAIYFKDESASSSVSRSPTTISSTIPTSPSTVSVQKEEVRTTREEQWHEYLSRYYHPKIVIYRISRKDSATNSEQIANEIIQNIWKLLEAQPESL